MESEDGEGEGGISYHSGRDGAVDGHEIIGRTHRGELAGPAPIGGDEGLDEFFEGRRQGQHRPRQGQLEAYQIDAQQGGLIRGAEQGADGQTDGCHGGIDKHQEKGAVWQGAWQVNEVLDEKRHPEGLADDEQGEEDRFAEQVGSRTQAGETFLFINKAFAGDFPR